MEEWIVREQLSALLDGELDIEMAETVLCEVSRVGLIETADIYFQIRDVLQGGEPYRQPSCRLLPAIRERLKTKFYLSVDLNDPDAVRTCELLAADVTDVP